MENEEKTVNIAGRLPKIAAVDALDAHREWNRKRKKRRDKLTNLFFFQCQKVIIWRAVSAGSQNCT